MYLLCGCQSEVCNQILILSHFVVVCNKYTHEMKKVKYFGKKDENILDFYPSLSANSDGNGLCCFSHELGVCSFKKAYKYLKN